MAFFSKDNKEAVLPPTEEQGFDFSVLWADEEPGSFTLPLIVITVMQAAILIMLFFKK